MNSFCKPIADGRVVYWLGTKSGADKGIQQGKQTLVKFDDYDWSQHKEVTSEFFTAPALSQAHDEIIRQHKPKHNVALFSLCTATRPYSHSWKWDKFYEYGLHNYSDFIVMSSGGIIPLEFEDCYPFMNYDTGASLDIKPESEQVYFDVTCKKLTEFLTAHPYEYCIFFFAPNTRATRIANAVCSELVDKGIIRDFYVGLSKEEYRKISLELYNNSHLFRFRYAQLSYKTYETLEPVFNKWGIPYRYNTETPYTMDDFFV